MYEVCGHFLTTNFTIEKIVVFYMLNAMKTEIVVVGPFEANCAIVWNGTKKSLIIDPGEDAFKIEAVLHTNYLSVEAYLITHGHIDHLSALNELHRVHPAPVYIHAEDLRWAFGEENQHAPYYSIPEKPVADFLHPEDFDILEINGFRFKTLETPGHTPGCVCYYFEEEKMLFTGDTLFKGSCGRTDLVGGNGQILAQSLKKLVRLPNEVEIHAGHGKSTSIGHEKRTNIFMQSPEAAARRN